MAFSMRNLSVLAYASGFTLWHYKARRERLDEVAESGFFSGAAEMVAGGDLMMVSALDGARLLCIAAVQGPSGKGIVTTTAVS